MALMKDKQELAAERRQREAANKVHLEKSIRKYGNELGTAYHQYIFDSDTRADFSRTIARILESANTTEKVLAINAMLEACEQRTKTMIQEAVRGINPVY